VGVVRTRIFQTGNSAAVRLPRAVLEAMDSAVGDAVTLSVDDQHRLVVCKAEGDYERTRASARRMRARYPRTLDILGQ
jgi:antitoxin component of MazEF toxin-antitoxin module